MPENRGLSFSQLDPESRFRSIGTTRHHLRLTESKLAGKLVAQAAGLIREAFPQAEEIVFTAIVCPSDTATVHITVLRDVHGEELNIRPDFDLDDPALAEAQTALAEAADLGATFGRADRTDRRSFMIKVSDPLDGVRLPFAV